MTSSSGCYGNLSFLSGATTQSRHWQSTSSYLLCEMNNRMKDNLDENSLDVCFHVLEVVLLISNTNNFLVEIFQPLLKLELLRN